MVLLTNWSKMCTSFSSEAPMSRKLKSSITSTSNAMAKPSSVSEEGACRPRSMLLINTSRRQPHSPDLPGSFAAQRAALSTAARIASGVHSCCLHGCVTHSLTVSIRKNVRSLHCGRSVPTLWLRPHRQVIRWIRRRYSPNTYKLDPDAINSHFRIPVCDIEAFEEKRRGWQPKTK